MYHRNAQRIQNQFKSKHKKDNKMRAKNKQKTNRKRV